MPGAPKRAILALVLLGCQFAALTGVAEARIALVADGSKHVVAFDTATNQTVGAPIPTGIGPFGIAITPNARKAYVTNVDIGRVQTIDVANLQVVGSPLLVGGGPNGPAVTPDGTRAYVATNGEQSVAVIDTLTDSVGTPIPVDEDPEAVAIAPNGRTAYAVKYKSGDVAVIDLANGQVTGSIPVGDNPRSIAITPDGRRAYVTCEGSGAVTAIDTATNQAFSPAIPVGERPRGIAVTPDGSRAYAVVEGTKSVVVIDTATNQVTGAPIIVGDEPRGISITPDGKRAYVANQGSGSVSAIDTATNQVVGPEIPIGAGPQAIAITPDQPPVADLPRAETGRPGAPVSLAATGSSDPDGAVAGFSWDFGDGQSQAAGPATAQHTYSRPGSYTVTLTVTDNEGCSTALRFTGQTAYCSGSAAARTTEVVTVAYSGVRVRCPKSAGPRGCRFKLTAVTKRRRGKAMSAVARGRAKAGRKALIALRPKPRFNARFNVGRKLLVREAVTIAGETETRLVKLKLAPGG